jgi:hypothetical protein
MVVFLFAGVAALIVTLIVTQGRKRTETLQSAASTFGGAVSSSFWSGDRVDLVVDGVPAEVTFHSGGKHSSPWTRLHFRWTPPGLLRLVPEDLFTSLQKVFGTQDLQVGDPDFDRRFLVRGSPEAWVREVLDAGTRRHLIGIAELGGSGRRGGLEAGPSGVVLFRHKNLCMDRILLEAFIQKSIEVFRRLRAPAPAEIKILSTEELIARGECPVCGHPLDATARRCKSCATAHHAECWDYFGGCSTCGGARQGGKPEA